MIFQLLNKEFAIFIYSNGEQDYPNH